MTRTLTIKLTNDAGLTAFVQLPYDDENKADGTVRSEALQAIGERLTMMGFVGRRQAK